MAVQTFKDWMKVKESTAFTRSRSAAASGLGPTIPDAEINAHSTATPAVRNAILKRNKHDKKMHHKSDVKLPPA